MLKINFYNASFARPLSFRYLTVLGLDEYADGCRIQKGADRYPFCLGGDTGREVWGVGGPSGVSTLKRKRVVQEKLKILLCTA